MKRTVTMIEWKCDFKGRQGKACIATSTSYDKLDTPNGWTSFDGAMQEASGGGPATFDLCPKHSTTFDNMFKVHRDIDDEDQE